MTFRDPESARRACADPTPIIDGRRANCNLASLGRPRPAMPFGNMHYYGCIYDILSKHIITIVRLKVGLGTFGMLRSFLDAKD